jgi:CBS domain-containing protein
MLVEDLMTVDPVIVNPDTTLADAARIMLDRHLSGLPVVDESGDLVGVITEGDLLRRPELGTQGKPASWLMAFVAPARMAEDYAHTHTRHVREAMTASVTTVTRGTELAVAAALMVRKHIKRLPVLSNGKLVGIISRSDLLGALALQLLKSDTRHPAPASIKQYIVDTMAHESWAPKSGIRIEVEGTTVTLEGVVFSDAERKAVHVIAENAPGVREVIDSLVYVDAGSGMAFPAA